MAHWPLVRSSTIAQTSTPSSRVRPSTSILLPQPYIVRLLILQFTCRRVIFGDVRTYFISADTHADRKRSAVFLCKLLLLVKKSADQTQSSESRERYVCRARYLRKEKKASFNLIPESLNSAIYLKRLILTFLLLFRQNLTHQRCIILKA